MEITEEKLSKLHVSDIKLKLIKLILESNNILSMNESRPNLDIFTGYVGDTLFEVFLNHPVNGEVKISGRNLP